MSKIVTYITLSGKYSIKYDMENPQIIKVFSAHQTQEYDKVEERDIDHIHYHPLIDISYEDLAGIWLAIHSSMLIKKIGEK